jgi:hypothetical protein
VGNHIYDGGELGILVRDGAAGLIEHNHIHGNVLQAILVDGATTAPTIRENNGNH